MVVSFVGTQLIANLSAATEWCGADKRKILDSGPRDIGVDAAEVNHVLRRIESGHPVAAVAESERMFAPCPPSRTCGP